MERFEEMISCESREFADKAQSSSFIGKLEKFFDNFPSKQFFYVYAYFIVFY